MTHPGAEAIPLQLTTRDGHNIAAIKYPAQAPLLGNLVMAGATGVPQGFYRRFALYAAARGYTVLTLDYRGIGLSKPASLKGFRISYLDWGRQDLAAAVDAMAEPGVPLFMVGHSYGGHALGLLPNHDKIDSFYTFATGAGWHGWMPPLERLRVLFMWRVLGPLIVRWKGYLAWKMLGMGEDLPIDVYRQWKHWCRFPHYFFDDPAAAGMAEKFAEVRTPIVAANALDDSWAPPSSRDAFMRAYSGSAWQAETLDPKTEGIGPIGHMGYFRNGSEPLWARVLERFGAQAARPA